MLLSVTLKVLTLFSDTLTVNYDIDGMAYFGAYARGESYY
jgi:hypothetical protein